MAFNQTPGLMHSFINFQGQVLRLAQGDIRLFNYVDNLIAFHNQGLSLEVMRGLPFPHGSDELDPALTLEFAPKD